MSFHDVRRILILFFCLSAPSAKTMGCGRVDIDLY